MNLIGHYPKAIDKKLCDQILDFIYSGKLESKDSKFQNDHTNYIHTTYPVTSELDDINQVMIKTSKTILQEYFQENKIAELVSIFNYDYSHSNIDKLEEDIGLPLHYDKEFDEKSFISKRNFVIIVYLNDIEVGGELCFPLQKKVIKPSAGDMVIIPTFFTHPHYVNPPMFSDRYAYHINYTTKKTYELCNTST